MNIAADLGWVKHHVILLAIVVGLAFAGIYTVESLVAKHDAEQASAYKALADAQAKQNQEFQVSVQMQVKAIADQNAELEKQNATLITALMARQKVENNLPTANSSLTTQQAADQIQLITKGQAHPNGSWVEVDTPTAQVVVTQLELVPLLEQDKADLQSQNKNFIDEIKNDEKALDLEKQSHQSDNAAYQATIKSDGAALSSCKANARKSKFKWFGIGVIVGFIGRGFAGF